MKLLLIPNFVRLKRGRGNRDRWLQKEKGNETSCSCYKGGVAIETSFGNEQRFNSFESLMEGLRLKKGGKGRPKERPIEVNADGAYDSLVIRSYLRKRGIRANIPVNERRRIKPRVGRPFRFLVRNSVERFFGWLKGGFRRLALRYERLLSNFKGFLYLASFIIAWRVLR